MACPSTTPLSGSNRVDAGYYTSRASAIAAASGLAPGSAIVQAGLEFNKFECPERLCKKKTQGPVTHTITSTDSSISWMATIGWGARRYTGRAYYDWRTTVTCESSLSALGKELVDKFQQAVFRNVGEGNHYFWFEGWLGNFFSWIGWAKGCGVWTDWTAGWLEEKGWTERGVRICRCYNWTLFFKHQVVCVTLPDGTRLIFDPWRDIDNPVWLRDDYEKQFGEMTCE